MRVLNISVVAFFTLQLIAAVSGSVVTIDKEFYSQSFSDFDFTGWTIGGTPAPTSNLATACDGQRLFGGYNLFTGNPTGTPTYITRTWSSLPPHMTARIRAKIYKIDSWQNRRLNMLVDGVATSTYTWSSSFGGGDTCGTFSPSTNPVVGPYNDGYVLVDANVTHTSNSITVRIETDLSTDGAAFWGIREFSIDLDNCLEKCGSCNTSTSCLTCPSVLNMQPAISLGAGQYDCQCDVTHKTQLSTHCTSPNCIACKAVCDSGYFPHAAQCYPCHWSCATCSGAGTTAATCLSCNPHSYYLNNSNTAQICMACDPSCYECSGSLSTQCTACTGGLLLDSGTCISTCPSGKYGKESLGTCESCASNCLTCYSNLATECTSCANGYFLDSGQCVTTCPPTYFTFSSVCYETCPEGSYDDGSAICQACTAFCLNCSAVACVICAPTYSISGGLCVPSCASGQFSDPVTTVCSGCDPSCASCTNSSTTGCLTCTAGLTLMPDGSCAATCAPGTFLNETGSCQSCDPSCLTCFSRLNNNCITCDATKFFHLNLSTCVPLCNPITEVVDLNLRSCWTCPAGYSPYNQTCIECHKSCHGCGGNNFDDCTLCTPDRYLSYGMCLCLPGTKDTIQTCQAGSSDESIVNIVWYLFLANCCIALVLELLFIHSTNVIMALELFQVISYSYFISVQLPTSNGNIYNVILKSHIGMLMPSVIKPLNLVETTKGRYASQGFSGYLLYDIQSVVIVYAILTVFVIFGKIVKTISDPRSEKKMHNVGELIYEKSIRLVVKWFRLTAVALFTSTTLTFQYFQWDLLEYQASLAFFIMAIALFFVLLCTKTWDIESKTYQFKLAYSEDIDYKILNPDYQLNVLTTEITNDTKENLMKTEVDETMSKSNVADKSETRKLAEPPKNVEDGNLTIEQALQSESKYKSNQLAPLTSIFMMIVMSVGIPLLREYPTVQCVFYTMVCGMIGSTVISLKWKRKVTKINNLIGMIIITINGAVLTAYTTTGSLIAATILLYLPLFTSILFLLMTFLQLLVNIAILPAIICKIPARIYKAINRNPQ